MKRVLFVCTFYGARALIAEKIAKSRKYPNIEIFSSCFEQGKIGSRISTLLKEKNIDLDNTSPRLVWDRYNNDEKFDLVITLCNDMTSEQCPVFNANIDTLYGRIARIQSWSIPDFASIEGDDAAWFEQARIIRDLIEYKVDRLLAELSEAND